MFAVFEAAARRHGDRPILHFVEDTARRYGCDSGELRYDEAFNRCLGLVRAYSGIGIESGARVAFALGNRPEFFLHWFALNALGASVVPLNPHWRGNEASFALEHSGAAFVVCSPNDVRRVQQLVEGKCRVLDCGGPWARRGPAEPDMAAIEGRTECALLYTSGTTGHPKGCVLSNEYFLVSGLWYRELGGYCRLRPGEERLITPLPMHHMNAMAVSTMAMLLTGGCVVPLDRFHPRHWWANVRESRATIMHYLGVMPAMLMNICESPDDRRHDVRFGFGAGLSGELHAAFEERFGMPLIEAWAMTETGCATAIIANEEPRKIGSGCIGRPPAHMEIRIINDSGEDTLEGTPGELLVRRTGPRPNFGMFSCYLKDPAATAEAWRDGYFHTGDLVWRDGDGLLHFLDRKKNIIRRSGENISAVEVEEALLTFPGVAAAGVAPVPDAVRGDEVFACVVMADGDDTWPDTAFALVRHCLGQLAYYKAPGYLARCAVLPLTETEKIQRASLRELVMRLLESGDCVDARSMKRADQVSGGRP